MQYILFILFGDDDGLEKFQQIIKEKLRYYLCNFIAQKSGFLILSLSVSKVSKISPLSVLPILQDSNNFKKQKIQRRRHTSSTHTSFFAKSYKKLTGRYSSISSKMFRSNETFSNVFFYSTAIKLIFCKLLLLHV